MANADRIPDITQQFAEDILRATMATDSLWVRCCKGTGDCTHDDDRWYWTNEHGEVTCHGRGEARLSWLIRRMHVLFGRLVMPDGCYYEPAPAVPDELAVTLRHLAEVESVRQAMPERFTQEATAP